MIKHGESQTHFLRQNQIPFVPYFLDPVLIHTRLNRREPIVATRWIEQMTKPTLWFQILFVRTKLCWREGRSTRQSHYRELETSKVVNVT